MKEGGLAIEEPETAGETKERLAEREAGEAVVVATQPNEEEYSEEDEGDDEGDETRPKERVERETVRLCVPLCLVIDYHLIKPQPEEETLVTEAPRPCRSRKEVEYYDLSDPFIDDAELLLQEDDEEIDASAFRAFAADASALLPSASSSPTSLSSSTISVAPKRLMSELPVSLRPLMEELEKKVNHMNLKKANPGRVPEDIYGLLLELEKNLQNESRITKQKTIQYLCQHVPWSAQTIRSRMRSLRENEKWQKELDNVLKVLEERITLDIYEYHLSVSYNTSGGNVTAIAKDGITKMKYCMRGELYQDLIESAVKLDEQLRNKKGDKASAKARANTTIFQTIADLWPASVTVEPKRIEAEYKRNLKEVPEAKVDNMWASKPLESIVGKKFTGAGLELLVTANGTTQWVLCTCLYSNPNFRPALDVFLTTPASKASLTLPISPAPVTPTETTLVAPRPDLKKRKHISASLPMHLPSEDFEDEVIGPVTQSPRFWTPLLDTHGMPALSRTFCAYPNDAWNSKGFTA